MKEHFGCPIQATSNAIAGKWKVLILWHLSYASTRFGELRDLLPGVSEKQRAMLRRVLQRQDADPDSGVITLARAELCGRSGS